MKFSINRFQLKMVNWLVLVLLLLFTGCWAPSARLSFPRSPLKQVGGLTWYDVNHDGKPGFAVSTDAGGRIDTLYYADHDDGKPDRIYHLSDYADRDVPHVIILLDSIPYQSMADAYAAGHFRWFGPPQKVIAPFPSLTEICYSDVLHAPPLPGMIDQSYDPRTKSRRSALWDRINGYSEPWERRVDYHMKYWEDGLSYLHPRPWYGAELERARAAVENSPYPVTLVYTASASSMVCKYGREGVAETLAGAEQLCLELLYQRHGAVKISLMADHGHNLMHSTNVPVDDYLQAAGLHPSDTICKDDDVVVEINGLVTYAAVQTRQPERVAEALLPHREIQLVMYMEGDRVIVRDAKASAAIECRDGKLRYVPIKGDVLNYQPVLAEMAAKGKLDAKGFASDKAWFAATVDGRWPDAPRRIWDAFHRIAVYPPQVMFTLNDGYCAGLKQYARFIDMASTHGGLNQINSATFVMTMERGRKPGPMRSRDVLQWLEPGFIPTVHEK
jgi:hypothetical protein